MYTAMAANTGKLAGKTVFISGASRGIGKAIGLKCAKDGANVVIAAKTVQPHPKLHGTIYTAAEEMDKAGGKGHACVVDIRSEEQVVSAVKETVGKFGGIDILINNASAISLTGTLHTPMKKYDLMNQINARGTYLCSQACLPYLLKSSNPHILNISPPLNLNPIWFKGHVAYTMAKYGMTMCALGMAHEFKDEGIAVNTLWPRTGIWTAAMEMLGGGDNIKSQCRSVDIMSDSAYVILTKNSRDFTGNFVIDDEILASVGITDLEKYSVVPGGKLLPDFFLDASPEEFKKQMTASGTKAPFKTSARTYASSSGESSGVRSTFDVIQTLVNESLVNDMKATYQFELSGYEAGNWFLDLKNGNGSVGEGKVERPDCVMKMDSQLFQDMFAGKSNATMMFMAGKLKISGDMGKAMKLEKIMKKVNSKL